MPEGSVKKYPGKPNTTNQQLTAVRKLVADSALNVALNYSQNRRGILALIGLRAGTLDAPSLFNPSVDIFTSSAAHWDFMNPDIPKLQREPG